MLVVHTCLLRHILPGSVGWMRARPRRLRDLGTAEAICAQQATLRTPLSSSTAAAKCIVPVLLHVLLQHAAPATDGVQATRRLRVRAVGATAAARRCLLRGRAYAAARGECAATCACGATCCCCNMLCRLLQRFMMARTRTRAQVSGAHVDGGAVRLPAQSRARHQRCSRGSSMAQPQQTR